MTLVNLPILKTELIMAARPSSGAIYAWGVYLFFEEMERAAAPLAVPELQACRLTGIHLPKEINGPTKGFQLLGTVDMLKCHRNHCPGKHNANA
jgi:hypothetical protein